MNQSLDHILWGILGTLLIVLVFFPSGCAQSPPPPASTPNIDATVQAAITKALATATVLPAPTSIVTPLSIRDIPTSTEAMARAEIISTFTPTPISTATPIPTATKTPTPTRTATRVPTSTRTPTATASPTATWTPVPTATPTNTPTPTPIPTSTPSPTPTYTPEPTATPIGGSGEELAIDGRRLVRTASLSGTSSSGSTWRIHTGVFARNWVIELPLVLNGKAVLYNDGQDSWSIAVRTDGRVGI